MNIFYKSLTYSMMLIAVLPVALLSVAAEAQDAQGNYYSNESPVRYASGSLWRVIADDGLNCRRSASLQSPIVRTYLLGSILEVEVYRGGSDEVLINSLDENGKPWMPVKGKDLQNVCFVRANSRYIQPVTN